MSLSDEEPDYGSLEEEYMGGGDDDLDALIVDTSEHDDDEENNKDNDDEEDTDTLPTEIVTFGAEAQYSKYETIVTGDDRITSNIMSKFEMTECVGIRATQIESNGRCYVDIDGLTSPILMAKRELMMRMCPLLIKRTVGYRTIVTSSGQELERVKEEWSPNLMQFSTYYPEAM